MIRYLRRRWIELRFRSNALWSRFLRHGSAAYRRRTSEELGHYAAGVESVHDERGLERAPAVWEELQERAAGLIRARVGSDLVGYAAEALRRRNDARMISLGSGPGGVELAIAREAPGARIRCLDLNPELIEKGRQSAAEEGLALEFELADLNTVELRAGEYDVVLCHASLHHVLELETLAEQIRRTLRNSGELVVVDILTRDGYRMWPENRRVVRDIWKTLPARFRRNHTGYQPEKRVDRKIWEWDTRAAGMECLRPEAVLPALRKRFDEIHFVPYFSLCRRFFDPMYGPNYDLEQPLDKAIVDWIWELDCELLRAGVVRPETFFGVYR